MATLQEDLNAAGVKAAAKNKTYTVFIGEEPIYFSTPLVVPPHVSLCGTGRGNRSGRLIYNGGTTTEPLIKTTGNGYGAVLSDFELRVSDPALGNLIGIYPFWDTKNFTIRDIRFAHYGKDCVGIKIAGRESATIEKVDIRCSVPIELKGGDNHILRDLDIGTSVTEEQRITMHSGALPCTCVLLSGMPNQWIFEGYQTWQGGNHAIYGRITSPSSGQALVLKHVRYEQTLSATSKTLRAVDIKFFDRLLETMVIGDGCRFTNRLKCYYITGVHNIYVSDGTWLGGDKWYRSEVIA